MAADDAIPDRAELTRTAARRSRNGRFIATIVLVVLPLVLTPMALMAGSSGSLSSREAVGLVGMLWVVAALGAVVAWGIHRLRPRPPLLAGTSRTTRRAVQQALRTGQPHDARIDALAREAAQRTLRGSWLLWLYSGLLALNVALLVLRIADQDEAWKTALAAANVVLWAALVALVWVTRRRSARYLRQRQQS
ncbi:hypothetical protein O7635_23815 [Asanoa sp. WMMD1127]|uniref:hypothetical protein n=1 Tax=Asanoa sp. WMMD1127 TaxID=3016107 RepID=UPI0024172AF3|nr:hypothetical protein [Asanoa sp. WMMD1127]MDG4824888.1 hypothetical protein [Asanoa sp. WMMD1127]